VIGAGGAGMYAALEAARAGAAVVLADRSLIGRGGATVMCANDGRRSAGLAGTPDHWEHHLSDTLAADAVFAMSVLPHCCARMVRGGCERWMTGRSAGRARTVISSRRRRRATIAPVAPMSIFFPPAPRCRAPCARQLNAANAVRRIGELVIVDIAVRDGEACGATALHLADWTFRHPRRQAVVIATAGLTGLYRRNSASSNMAVTAMRWLCAPAPSSSTWSSCSSFPLATLRQGLVGMDPIMWIRSATNLAASCSMPKCVNSSRIMRRRTTAVMAATC